MEYTVINYLFDKGETVSEGICFTSQSKVTGLQLFVSKRQHICVPLDRTVLQLGEHR